MRSQFLNQALTLMVAWFSSPYLIGQTVYGPKWLKGYFSDTLLEHFSRYCRGGM